MPSRLHYSRPAMEIDGYGAHDVRPYANELLAADDLSGFVTLGQKVCSTTLWGHGDKTTPPLNFKPGQVGQIAELQGKEADYEGLGYLTAYARRFAPAARDEIADAPVRDAGAVMVNGTVAQRLIQMHDATQGHGRLNAALKAGVGDGVDKIIAEKRYMELSHYASRLVRDCPPLHQTLIGAAAKNNVFISTPAGPDVTSYVFVAADNRVVGSGIQHGPPARVAQFLMKKGKSAEAAAVNGLQQRWEKAKPN